MCGLAGVWRKRGAISRRDMDDVAAMMEAAVHRGPDGHGTWRSERVALGHRRLSIIDLSDGAAQPMATPSGGAVLIHNGEVYNFRAIRSLLEGEGVSFRTSSDTEVVLHALDRWGPEAAVRRFNGMFSFAFLDVAGNELWLCRDRLGIKPLSVAETGDRILFASEDKQLLATNGFARSIDSREITLRLAGQYRDNAASLFAGIERLGPGELWKITDAGIEKKRFWHVLGALDADRITANGSGASAAALSLESLLRESVGLHCVSDAPLAAACSGGVDSGLITTLAGQVRPQTRGYVVDPLLGFSEAENAERTGRKAGVEIRRVPLDRRRFLELWPKTVWHLESDGWHASLIGLLALTEQCRADGIKVLLTGEGADELFGGYTWHRLSMKKWRPAVWPASLFRSRKSLDRFIARARTAPFNYSMGGGSLREHRAVMRSLSPDMQMLQTQLFDALEPVAPLTDRAFLANCLYDLYGHLQDLLHRHDRISMASSVEMRVPFIENQLIDFAVHLPRRLKIRGKAGKWLLRQVALRHLPASNVKASKNGFGISAAFSEGSQELLRDGLLRDAMRWSRPAVDAMLSIASDHEYSRQRLVGMEIFLRLYQAGETPATVTERLLACAVRRQVRDAA